MYRAELFREIDQEDLKRYMMHIRYELSSKKSKEHIFLKDDMYYFIDHGQAILRAKNQFNKDFTTVVDSNMIVTTKTIGNFGFQYELEFTDSVMLYSIEKKELEKFLSEQDNTNCFLECILNGIQNLLERMVTHIASLQTNNSQERLYCFLKGISRNEKQYVVCYTRGDLGRMTNMKRETCSKDLSEMENNGLIEILGQSIKVF